MLPGLDYNYQQVLSEVTNNLMPTVLRSGSYRFFFYAGDQDEPPHVHVERGDNLAKFWLEPVRIQRSGGFTRKEINTINRLVEENAEFLIGKWNDFFTD
jgi:hypothetical protein